MILDKALGKGAGGSTVVQCESGVCPCVCGSVATVHARASLDVSLCEWACVGDD
jgi:hypothetical protein